MSRGPSDDDKGGTPKTDKDNAKEDHSFVAMTLLNFKNLAGYADASSSKKERGSIDDRKMRSFEEMKLSPPPPCQLSPFKAAAAEASSRFDRTSTQT